VAVELLEADRRFPSHPSAVIVHARQVLQRVHILG
jgi:hypothetical protein